MTGKEEDVIHRKSKATYHYGAMPFLLHYLKSAGWLAQTGKWSSGR